MDQHIPESRSESSSALPARMPTDPLPAGVHRLFAPARTGVLLALLVIVAANLGGCNIIAPLHYVVHGPAKVDAEHQLADVPTVVFVDDRENVVNPTLFRRVIAEKVSEDLMVRKVLTRTISPHDAMSLVAQHDTNKEVMPIDAIGRAVGAEQIIYIEMVSFTDRVEPHVPRPMGSCRVRVIDVNNRERLYPAGDVEQPFRAVQVAPREVDPELYRTRATRMRINEVLAEEMGDRIAKLFYKHEARELGGSLNPR